jgi:hypothetical protein
MAATSFDGIDLHELGKDPGGVNPIAQAMGDSPATEIIR